MTKSLISFPANLEMVNNETDVTRPASQVPGARTVTMDATTAASSPSSNTRLRCGTPKASARGASGGESKSARTARSVPPRRKGGRRRPLALIANQLALTYDIHKMSGLRERVDLMKMTHHRHWLCTAAMVLMPGLSTIKVLV
jgi:hypothetical protein